ncbi:TPA: hypothetical protein DEF17_06795 [bacterium]|nr:MAG: hypothetical protein AUJ18_03220 [Candidatus Hydrogenedentes bacterium CG1_02_42_14]PIU48736.1 MAG: hypothetical protein COS94_00705 [Candidatus Hydrogenedentes bacterium CG07_land_8_20_14_0_80_42_17]HBW47625.1 hypothetical protein [bacterium]
MFKRNLIRLLFFVSLIILAIAFRLWLAHSYPQKIDSTDAEQYITLASNMISGRGYSLWHTAPFYPDVYRSPGYPLFLALLMKFGINQFGRILVQIGLELFSICLGAFAIFKVSNERAGWSALIFALFCPFTASISTLFNSEALAMPIITLIFAIPFLFSGYICAVSIALLTGILILTRGIFLPALPLGALIFFLARRNTSLGCRLKMPAIFTAVVLISILPYGLWNYETHGKFSFTPLAGFGRALWGGVAMMPGFKLSPPEDAWKIHESIWRKDPTHPAPQKLIQADHELKEIAKKEICRLPLRYLYGVARHAIHMWFGVRFLFPFNNPTHISTVLRILGSLYFLLAVWMWIRLQIDWKIKLLGFMPAIVTAVTLPWLYFTMRYTSAIYGPFSILAGAAFFSGKSERFSK